MSSERGERLGRRKITDRSWGKLASLLVNKINTDQSELHALYSQSSTSTSFSLRGFCSKKLLLTRLLRERSHYFYDCKKVFFVKKK